MRFLPFFALVTLAACGPSVSEMRLVAAPARPRDCKLVFLHLDMKDVVPGGPWEILGHVTLGESGEQDPLKPEYREEVRPRACRMGGEAVAILMTATSAGGALTTGSTMVDYVVVRPRRAEKAPQRF